LLFFCGAGAAYEEAEANAKAMTVNAANIPLFINSPPGFGDMVCLLLFPFRQQYAIPHLLGFQTARTNHIKSG
jgi:hypothetical protein